MTLRRKRKNVNLPNVKDGLIWAFLKRIVAGIILVDTKNNVTSLF